MYPEHEKVAALGANKDLIAEFLDFLLDEKGFTLAIWEKYPEYTESRLISSGYGGDSGRETLMAEFFHIDLRKLDEEKRAMLAELRK